jgi:hypothetical protein
MIKVKGSGIVLEFLKRIGMASLLSPPHTLGLLGYLAMCLCQQYD